MIFKKINKQEVKKIFDVLKDDYDIIAPVAVGEDKNKKTIYSFKPVSDSSEMRLDYSFTKIPPKKYFLNYEESLAKFSLTEDQSSWSIIPKEIEDKPVVFWGLHACDINGLNKLDKVLMKSIYPAPYYVNKRKNTFIIGSDCIPSPHCFCRSLGVDTATHGYDMFFTDIGEEYYVEILSSWAFQIIQKVTTREVNHEDDNQMKHLHKEKQAMFQQTVDTTDMAKILDMEFQSEKWKKWGERCLGCGSCARVCPTCYCYGVTEDIDLKFKVADKKKKLYSCNLIDFAEVAGGHNFRPDMSSRLKYRYYHKHRGFVEQFEESLCVGCGRCGEQCLAGINVPEVIGDIRKED